MNQILLAEMQPCTVGKRLTHPLYMQNAGKAQKVSNTHTTKKLVYLHKNVRFDCRVLPHLCHLIRLDHKHLVLAVNSISQANKNKCPVVTGLNKIDNNIDYKIFLLAYI